MIFITVGSQDKQFKRLFDEIIELINKNIITEKVVAQVGCNKVEHEKIETYKMLTQDEFEKFIKKSDLVITHGGVGSLIDALKYNKKIVAVPRKKEFNECANDHQLQIVETFSREDYIIGVNDVSEIESAIKKAKKFAPKKYVRNNKLMLNIIENYIDELWYNLKVEF